MAKHRISGVWKNANSVITHYAVHTVSADGKTSTRAQKRTKAEAIALAETQGNTVETWLWDYLGANWKVGEQVHVVQGANGKYLRSNKDNQLTDNLGHLINFDWIAP